MVIRPAVLATVSAMPRSSRRPLASMGVASVLVASVLVAGSFAVLGAGTAGASTPKAWATKTCAALDGWVKSVQQRADKATKKVTRRATPSQKALVAMLEGSAADTKHLLSQLKSAGVPTGPDGKTIAKTTRTAFKQVRTTLVTSAKSIAKLKPKRLARFVEQARRTQDGLENGLERVEAIFGNTMAFDSDDLLAPLAAAKPCGKLSKRTTDASQADGPDGPVTIQSVTPASGPPGTVVSYSFENTPPSAAQECTESSAYRVELLGPDGAEVGLGGETVDIPADAQNGTDTIRVVCYFPGAYARPLMRSLCGQFEVAPPGTASAGAGGSAPCPETGRVLNGDSVIAVQRSLGDGFNILVGTIFGP